MDEFWKSFFGQIIKGTALCISVISFVLLFFENKVWIPGIGACFGWLILNSILLYQLLQFVKVPKQDIQKKIYAICLIKFPVLYLIGLVLLLLDWVLVEGVLLTFTIYLLMMAIVWVQRRGQMI